MSEATDQAAQPSTSMLSLKYFGAALAAVVAVGATISTVNELFGMWTSTSVLGSSGLAVLMGTNPYFGVVSSAVVAAVFAVVALLLYRQVSTLVQHRPSYVHSVAYRVITYGVFAAFALAALVMVADLIALLISSLLLIGTGTDIGALYLGKFLPELVAAGIAGFAAFMTYMIVKGRNKSSVLSVVLLCLAGAVLVATLITVPIKAHSGSSTSGIKLPSSSSYSSDWESLY